MKLIKDFIKGMALLCLPLCLVACSDENDSLANEKSHVTFSIDEFEVVVPARTTTDPNNNYAITWASGDVIGIFPREGYQEPFTIPTEQVGKTYATFDGGYWAMKTGLTYNAYYPFDKANFDSADMKTQIPVDYTGQKQEGTECGIGAYDYTYSDWTTATGSAINFSFHHIGAIIVFHLKYPATAAYTQLVLSADASVIPTKGTYDLTATTVGFQATEYASSLSMTLNDCSGTADANGVFYMMLPPMDLSSNEVIATLTSNTGTAYNYSLDVSTIIKGKKYELTGELIDSEAGGSTDGWEDNEEVEETDTIPYVTFTADTAEVLNMSSAVETLEYSVNGGEWATLGTRAVLFGGENGNLRLRGKSSVGTNGAYIVFNEEHPVSCSGDIRTLIDYENYQTVYTGNAKFNSLFSGGSKLTTAPELPAMDLAEGCYSSMFWCCASLVTAPELPATTLAKDCYRSMFLGCSNLTTAPELPATTLAEYCYTNMFTQCTNLTTAPELPATTLAVDCYSNMFTCCSSLTTLPQLPATNLAAYCYRGMFSQCENLTTAPELPAAVLTEGCYGGMFDDCSKLNHVTMLATDISATDCLTNWLENVSSSGTFIKAAEMTILPEGTSGIPSGWTVKDYSE